MGLAHADDDVRWRPRRHLCSCQHMLLQRAMGFPEMTANFVPTAPRMQSSRHRLHLLRTSFRQRSSVSRAELHVGHDVVRHVMVDHVPHRHHAGEIRDHAIIGEGQKDVIVACCQLLQLFGRAQLDRILMVQCCQDKSCGFALQAHCLWEEGL